jgi:3-dehydroquinate synthase
MDIEADEELLARSRGGDLAAFGALVERHRAAFARVGLPTSYDAASFDDLHAAMKVDKKARGSQLRFVVLDDVAAPRILAAPGEEDLRAAYAALASAG